MDIKLYYFTDEQYALDNLRNGHLKVSRFDNVNDPFEFSPYALGRVERKKWKLAIQDARNESGFISFTTDWANPTMWGHYGGRGKGLCYCFEVCETLVDKITYSPERLKPPKSFSKKDIERARLIKSKHWDYEQEHRMNVNLREIKPEGDLHFCKFSERLKLSEVIIGFNSSITSDCIRTALGCATEDTVKIKTARAAFATYRIVTQNAKNLQK